MRWSPGCERGVELLERRGVEHVLEHEVAELVELRGLLGGDRRARAGVVLPLEAGVPRVRHAIHRAGG